MEAVCGADGFDEFEVEDGGLPGGHRDAEDASPQATALRELKEELGLTPEAVTCFGELPPQTALRGTLVYPVLGFAAAKLTDLKPAAAEVAAVFTMPWQALQVPKSTPFNFTIFGLRRHSHLFRAAPRFKVWGLTASLIVSADLRPLD